MERFPELTATALATNRALLSQRRCVSEHLRVVLRLHRDRWMSCSPLESRSDPCLVTLDDDALARVCGGYAQELFGPMQTAVDMGLTINSTWTGRHSGGSAHYDGRAFDAIGSQDDMQRFYDWAAENTTPRQLIFRNGHIKDGRQARSVGGHYGHVHFSA